MLRRWADNNLVMALLHHAMQPDEAKLNSKSKTAPRNICLSTYLSFSIEQLTRGVT